MDCHHLGEGLRFSACLCLEVRLRYDPAAEINITNAWIPSGDRQYIFYGRDTACGLPSFGDGWVIIGQTLLTQSGVTPPSDPAMLAVIEFQTTDAPGKHETLSTYLDIDNEDTFLLDDALDLVQVIKTDGSYTYAPQHDVAVTDVTSSVKEARTGWIVGINVTGANLGYFVETFNVTAIYDTTPIETQTVTNLDPSENVTLTFNWNTAGLAPGNYTLKAEASIVSMEVNIENNIFIDGIIEIKMLGDVDDDNKVDIRDMAIAALAFGSYPGHPRWNPQADLNQDDRVDIKDIALIAKNFGDTFSYMKK